MPTFDGNLNPQIEGSSNGLPIPVNPGGSPSLNGLAAPDSSTQLSLDDLMKQPLQKKTPGYTPGTVSYDELNQNRRYDKYRQGVDNEDLHANAQSGWDKAANGVLKGLNLAGTTVAGSLAMLGGTVKAMTTGRLADVWDNEMTRSLDEWNKKVDNEYLPNYYSKKEQDAAWYSTDNWLTTNFLFDKLVKNSGFAVGAMITGNIANGALGAAGSTLGEMAWNLNNASKATKGFQAFSKILQPMARLFSAGKNIEVANILEEGLLKGLPTAERLAANAEQLTALAKTANAYAKWNDMGRRSIIALYSSAGEASFEALGTQGEFRDHLIAEYTKKNNGVGPDEAAMQKINAEADQVGRASFLGNMAVLGITEYVQLPNLIGSSYRAERQAAQSLLGAADDVVQDAATKAWKAAAPTTRFGKMYDKIAGVSKYFFDPKEAAQEGFQSALQVGVQNYYSKRYRGDEASVWADGVMYGLHGTDESGKGVGIFNSKEGAESMLLGGLTGGIMQAKAHFKDGRARAQNTNIFTAALTKAGTFNDALKDKIGAAQRGVVLQEEHEQAVTTGDVLEAKDLEHDKMHNYMSTRIKYGRYDMVKDDIDDLRRSALEQGGFEKLQANGMAAATDTKESFIKRLEEMDRTAANINTLYENLNLRYSGVRDKEGKQVYTPEVLDKMVYATSKIANYDYRLGQLATEMLTKGLSVDPTNLANLYHSEEVKDSIGSQSRRGIDVENLAAQIEEMDTVEDEKEELREKVRDYMELSFRRKEYINEYKEIKDKPMQFQENPEDRMTDAEKARAAAEAEGKDPNAVAVPKTIKVKTQAGEETELEVGAEYYLGKVIEHDAKGNEVYRFPRLTILGQNEDGTIRVKASNGNIRNISAAELEDYKLGKVETLKNNPKARFYLAHINDIFSFNFGKDKKTGQPKTQNGRLHFDSKTGKLTFVYKQTNSKGKSYNKTIEVTLDQFQPKKGFSQAMITKVGKLTAEQEQAHKDIQGVKDDRSAAKREARMQIIGELTDTTLGRLEEVNRKLFGKRDQLEDIRQKMADLRKDIRTDNPTWKKAMSHAIEGLTDLARLEEALSNEINQLEAEKDELEMHLDYFQDIANEVDAMPTDGFDFLEELQEQHDTLKELMVQKTKQLSELGGLLSEVQNSIKLAQRFLKAVLDRLKVDYPDYMKNAFERMAQAGGTIAEIPMVKKYFDDLALVEDTKKQITVDSQMVEDLEKEITAHMKELAQIEKEYGATKQLVERFEQMAEAYWKEEERKKALKENQALRAEIFGAQKTAEETSGEVATGDAAADRQAMAKESPRPKAAEVFTKTVAPSKDLKDHHKREQVFLNNVDNLPVEKRKALKAMVVSAGTEEALGLKGLVAKLLGGDTTMAMDPDKGVVAVVYVSEQEDGLYFVDKQGNSITKVGSEEEGILDQAIYATMPSTSLTDSHGDRFRAGEKEQVEARVDGYRAFRTEMLGLTGSQFQLFDFGVSRGIERHQEVNGQKVASSVVGTIIKNEDLDNDDLIQVSTTGVVTTVNGDAVNVPVGRPMLRHGSKLVFLNNRNLTADEQNVIFKLIRQLALNFEQSMVDTGKGSLDPQIRKFLQSVLYWRVPGENSTVGRNQIWIDMNGDLRIGKNGVKVPFTSQSIEAQRNVIMAYLQGTYNNVNTAWLSAETIHTPFEEVVDVLPNGQLQVRTWKSYQHYLLSDTYDLIEEEQSSAPTGSRAAVPLTTYVRPVSEHVENDYNFEQKYALLQGLDLPVKEIPKAAPQAQAAPKAQTAPQAAPKEAPKAAYVQDGKTEHEFTSSKGEKLLFTVDDKGEVRIADKLDFKKAIDRLKGDKATTDVVDQENATRPADAVKMTYEEGASDRLHAGLQQYVNSKIEEAQQKVIETPAPQVAPVVQPAAQPVVAAPKAAGEFLFETAQGWKIYYTIDGDKVTILDKGDKKELIALFSGMEDVKAAVAAHPEYTLAEAAEQKAEAAIGTKHQAKQATGTTAAVVATEAAQTANPDPTPAAASELRNKYRKPRTNSEYRRMIADELSHMVEDWSEIETYLKQVLPNVPVYRVKTLIETTDGGLAWGKFENGAIYIYENAEKGTTYHEVFEAVWGMFTTPGERAGMYAEFRQRAGSFTDRETGKVVKYSEATQHQAKEAIAEEFRAFTLTQKLPTTVRGRIAQFMRDLWQTIRALFGKRQAIQGAFNRIQRGAYRGAQPLNTDLGTPQYSKVGPFSERQTRDLIEDITVKVFRALFEGKGEGRSPSQRLFKADQISRTELYAGVKEELMGALVDRIDTLEERAAKASAQEKAIIANQVQQLDAFMAATDAHWEALIKENTKLLRQFNITFDEETADTTINSEEASRNEYARDAMKHDVKKTASSAVKLLMGTLVETVQTATNNKIQSLESTQEALALPQPALNEYGLEKPMNFAKAFVQVLEGLSNTTGIEGMMRQLAVLAKDNPNYVRLFTKLGGNRQTGRLDYSKLDFHDWRLLMSFHVTFAKQKPTALIQRIEEDDAGNIQVYAFSQEMQKASDEITNEWINNLRSLAQAGKAMVTLNSATKAYELDVAKFKGLSNDSPEGKERFLAALGISFTKEMQAKLTAAERGEFHAAVAGIRTAFNKSIAAKKEEDKIKVFNLSGKALDINGAYNTLSELAAKLTKPQLSSTAYNVENELVQIYVQNNALSKLENDVNSVKSLDELLQKRTEFNDVFSENSLLLKKGGLYFDKDGNRTARRLKVGYIGGIRDERKNSPQRPISKLTYPERLMLEFNQNLAGWFYALVPADSSTEWMMNYGNHISFGEMSNSAVMKRAHSIFKGYLQDEVALAREGRRGSAKLRFFEGIITDQNLKNKLIESGDVDALYHQVADHVQKFIDRSVNETRELLEDYGEIVGSGDNLEMKHLDTNFTSRPDVKLNKRTLSEEEVQRILLFRTLNYMFNNVEFHKTVFGEPQQFKDPTKRYKSFMSPRETSATDKEADTWANKNMNTVEGVTLTPRTLGYHQFKPYMKTYTMQDIMVVGSQALNEMNEAYEEIDEADATSWMLDSTYREARWKNGRWSEEDEAQYQYEMAYMRQNLNEAERKELGMEYPAALEKADRALLAKGNPGHQSFYILKPIGTGVKHGAKAVDNILDKTSAVGLFFRQVEKFPNARAHYLKMMKSQTGYVIVKSGRKVGNENPQAMYNPDGTYNTAPFNEAHAVNVPFSGWGIQVETSPHADHAQTRGSQITKLVTMDLMSNGVPVDVNINVEDWMKMTEAARQKASPVYKLIKQNQRLLEDMTEFGYSQLIKRLGVEDTGRGFRIVDVKKAQESLRDELLRRDVNDNVHASIEIDPLTGQFALPFEASPSYQQIKNVLFSMVDKTVISPKMNGGPKVQVSSALWEKNSRNAVLREEYTENGEKKVRYTPVTDFNSLTEAQKKNVRLTSNELHFYSKDKPYMEVYLPNWFAEKLKNQLGKDEEALLAHLNSEEGQKILTGIGFRIPTQALNSMEVFRVKGFLPKEMGDAIVVPSEITKKSGSDFDIDKLNTYLKNVYVNSKGEVKLVPYLGAGAEGIAAFKAKIQQGEFLSEKDMQELDRIIAEEQDSLGTEDHYDRLLAAIPAVAGLFSDEQITREFLEQYYQSSKGDKIEMLAEKLYKQSMENAYYESMEALLQLPQNFNRLIKTNESGERLKQLRDEVTSWRGEAKASAFAYSDLLRPKYMAKVRHNFIVGKGGVGIAAIQQTGHSLSQRTPMYVNLENLTKVSPSDRLWLGDGKILLDHNQVAINGTNHASLSAVTDKEGQHISDVLGNYIDGYVDIAKDAFIVEVGASPNVAATFMFLNRLGVPLRDVVGFMNQPIIQEYLKMLDRAGTTWIFPSSEKKLEGIMDKFPTTVSTDRLNPKNFEANVRKAYRDGKFVGGLNAQENAEQQLILREFFKYATMASHMFELNQGSNYDTAAFNDPALETKKRIQTERARTTNIISSVDDVLENSFIGKVKEYVGHSRNVVGAFLKLEQPNIRTLLDSVISVYSQKGMFISDKKFLLISKNVVSSFINYITQTETGLNAHIQKLMLDSQTAVAREVERLQATKDPKFLNLKDNPVIQDIRVLVSDRIGGPKNLSLKAKDKDVFTENQYISAFRELRSMDKALYKRIINLAILQSGVGVSPISFTHLIPMEDYADVMVEIVNRIPHMSGDDLANFNEVGAFFRNNWRDNTLVPKVKAKSFQSDYGWTKPMFDFVPQVLRNMAKEKGSQVAQLSAQYNSREVLYPFFKVLTKINVEGKDLFVHKLFKRVEHGDGTPYTFLDKKGNLQYLYKQVNAWGAGANAQEHYTTPQPSKIDNDTVKVAEELQDHELIAAYEGAHPQTNAQSETQKIIDQKDKGCKSQ